MSYTSSAAYRSSSMAAGSRRHVGHTGTSALHGSSSAAATSSSGRAARPLYPAHGSTGIGASHSSSGTGYAATPATRRGQSPAVTRSTALAGAATTGRLHAPERQFDEPTGMEHRSVTSDFSAAPSYSTRGRDVASRDPVNDFHGVSATTGLARTGSGHYQRSSADYGSHAGDATGRSSLPPSGRATPSTGGSVGASAIPVAMSSSPPVGFRNMGNTCYMNSSLQCVLHSTGTFLGFLRREPIRHHSEARRPSLSSSRYTSSSGAASGVTQPLTECYLNLADSSSGSTTALLAVKGGVSRMNSEFVGARQNDGHEFIRELLYGIHKEVNRVEGKPKYVEMKDIPGEADADAARRWIAYHRTHDNSVVYDQFGGFIRSVTKCGACSNRSFVFDPFLDLSVNVASNMLDGLAMMNKMEDVSMFKCEACGGKKVASLRQTVVVQWPKTLVIHLKRFSQSGRKDTSAVQYPTTITEADAEQHSIVLARGVSMPRGGYRLSGIVLHHGTMGFGHYTAFVRSGRTWYECDDNTITRVNESAALSSKGGAYVLFYSSED